MRTQATPADDCRHHSAEYRLPPSVWILARSNPFYEYIVRIVRQVLIDEGFEAETTIYSAETDERAIQLINTRLLPIPKNAVILADRTTHDVLCTTNTKRTYREDLGTLESLGAEALADIYFQNHGAQTLYNASYSHNLTIKGLVFLLTQILQQRTDIKNLLIVCDRLLEHEPFRDSILLHKVIFPHLSKDCENPFQEYRKHPGSMQAASVKAREKAEELREAIKLALETVNVEIAESLSPDTRIADKTLVIHDTHFPVPAGTLHLPLPLTSAYTAACDGNLISPHNLHTLADHVKTRLIERIEEFRKALGKAELPASVESTA